MPALPYPGKVVRGNEIGPCRDECQHTDCKCIRVQAATACSECGQPIGYETLFQSIKGKLRHRICLPHVALGMATSADGGHVIGASISVLNSLDPRRMTVIVLKQNSPVFCTEIEITEEQYQQFVTFNWWQDTSTKGRYWMDADGKRGYYHDVSSNRHGLWQVYWNGKWEKSYDLMSFRQRQTIDRLIKEEAYSPLWARNIVGTNRATVNVLGRHGHIHSLGRKKHVLGVFRPHALLGHMYKDRVGSLLKSQL